MSEVVKIANAQAFWGDLPSAAATLLEQQPDLDYVTLDYLSEVSLSIMAAQRAQDPKLGYARDFVEVVKSLVPFWQAGSKVKVITNAGGLAPRACALACIEALRAAACSSVRVGIVTGDDVVELIKAAPLDPAFANLESEVPAASIVADLETANAYLGAQPLEQALKLGADIVIAGRVADPSLTVAACVAAFNWRWDEYDKLAQATIAGHLIECGTQVTGGIATHWLDVPDPVQMGFPVVEMEHTGAFVVTKPQGAGGEVTVESVKEQLLYEIGDPEHYLSPDVHLSLMSVQVQSLAKNRIAVAGGIGSPPPKTYKVSATYRAGFKCEAMLAIFGRQAAVKARRCGQIVLERVQRAGYVLEHSRVECLGCGDVVPGIAAALGESYDTIECVLRIAVADHRREALECFAKQIAPLVTSGPQGTTGYTSGRPHIRPVFGYWPCLVPTHLVHPKVEIMEVSR